MIDELGGDAWIVEILPDNSCVLFIDWLSGGRGSGRRLRSQPCRSQSTGDSKNGEGAVPDARLTEASCGHVLSLLCAYASLFREDTFITMGHSP